MDTLPTMPPPAPDRDPPEKYIRTFADDMKTVQAGGTPDLAPLREPQPAVVEKPVPPAPSVPPPPTPPVTPVTPPIPAPVQAPTQKPEVPPAPPPEPPSPNIPKTYSGDFLDRVKETHASTATVLAAEQDSAPRPQPVSKESSRNRIYVIAGAVLLIAGVVGAYVAYTHYTATSTPVVATPVVSVPILVDDREEISGSGPALISAIEQSVNRPISVGTIRLLYFASTTATDSVFSALHASAPDILLRNVNVKGSMAGVINVNGTQSPFFILSVASYSNTFSGMLVWEPLVRHNLEILFPPYPTAPTVVAPIVATSTPTTTPKKGAVKTATSTPPVPREPTTFTDDTIANHDVRIYRDAAGRSVIVYGYWNQETLVIARDPAAFTGILQRLATARTP